MHDLDSDPDQQRKPYRQGPIHPQFGRLIVACRHFLRVPTVLTAVRYSGLLALCGWLFQAHSSTHRSVLLQEVVNTLKIFGLRCVGTTAWHPTSSVRMNSHTSTLR